MQQSFQEKLILQIINNWNSFPKNIVLADSVLSFKSRIGQTLDTYEIRNAILEKAEKHFLRSLYSTGLPFFY